MNKVFSYQGIAFTREVAIHLLASSQKLAPKVTYRLTKDSGIFDVQSETLLYPIDDVTPYTDEINSKLNKLRNCGISYNTEVAKDMFGNIVFTDFSKATFIAK